MACLFILLMLPFKDIDEVQFINFLFLWVTLNFDKRFVSPLGSLCRGLCVNGGTCISYFPVYISCLSFSCLVILARTVIVKLDASGENWYFCLVLDVRGNHSDFHYEVWMAGDFS